MFMIILVFFFNHYLFLKLFFVITKLISAGYDLAYVALSHYRYSLSYYKDLSVSDFFFNVLFFNCSSIIFYISSKYLHYIITYFLLLFSLHIFFGL